MRKADRPWLTKAARPATETWGLYPGIAVDSMPVGPAARLRNQGYIERWTPRNPAHRERWIATPEGHAELATTGEMDRG